MNRHQVIDLLSVATAYDNRQRSGAEVTAWTEAARRGRWTMDTALDAVHDHFAETTDYLMPGHITQRIKESRQSIPDESASALPAGPAAEPERVRTLVSEVARRLGWRRDSPESDVERSARAVECPHCHAAPRRPCTRQATRGPRRGQFVALAHPHPSRVDLVEANP